MKVAIYARYSSENQREASIEDHAISGATLMRPGFQAMMDEALRGKVDVVLAEALDRFSRDQEDTAALFQRLTFAGVSIVTLAEGDITFLHIGLKGTMNAMFLKELADKTRRGLRGRVELGKSGGGACFGYRIVRTFKDGVVSTGEREFVPGKPTSSHERRRPNLVVAHVHSCRRCRRAKAHPEPDLRYRSNLTARDSSANSIRTSIRHGHPVAVC